MDNCSAAAGIAKGTGNNKTSASMTKCNGNEIMNEEKNRNDNKKNVCSLKQQYDDDDVDNCGVRGKCEKVIANPMKSDDIVKSNSDKSGRTMSKISENKRNMNDSVDQTAKNACETNEKTRNVSLMKQNKCDININSDDVVVASIDSDKRNADVVIYDDDDDNAYAELEFYLENVEVSAFKFFFFVYIS